MIRLGRQPLTILMRLGETQMFPMPKVNVLQTALVTLHYVFSFVDIFRPNTKRKKMSILRKMLHYIPSHYENNLSSKVAPHGPQGGLCGEILP